MALARDLSIKSQRILACRDTLAAALETRFSGSFPEAPAETVDLARMPAGVAVFVTASLPAFCEPFRASDIDGLHDDAVGQAWRCGAWDVAVSLLPPLAGPQLGLVTAHMDYSADTGLRDILIEAAERGRLVTWSWLPMRGGPPLRAKAHAAKDATLRPDNGRDGAPPDTLPRPDFARRDDRSWIIRLGHAGR